MNKKKLAFIAVLIAIWLSFIWFAFGGSQSSEAYKPAPITSLSIPYSDLKNQLVTQPDDVRQVIVEKDSSGQPLTIILIMKPATGIEHVKAELPSNDAEAEIRSIADDLGIGYEATRPVVVDSGPGLGTVLLSMLPQFLSMALFAALVYFAWRMYQLQKSGGPNDKGKSKFRLIKKGEVKTTFADVEGIDETKQELQDVVQYLKDPSLLDRLGGKVAKGILLVGPPGTGKTLVARALAGEADCAFLSGGASSFVEMFVGVGASRVRDLFELARDNAPCIIFIDEIDGVGGNRLGLGGGNDEREQTLNELLKEMDGFDSLEGVIVVAATNRPDILDEALRRPGRFDMQVTVPLPDVVGRERIFDVHARGKLLDKAVNAKLFARQTFGYSGADIAGMLNQAVLVAARRIRESIKNLVEQGISPEEAEKLVPQVITVEDVTEGSARTKWGIRSASRMLSISQKEMLNTAIHELGHALIGEYLYRLSLGGDPIDKITIIPRSQALGVTVSFPETDRVSWTREHMLARICMGYGGRAAQLEVLGTTDSGASNDFEQAYSIAHKMVTKYGMSPLGFICVNTQGPRDTGFSAGPELLDKVDKEIERIRNEGWEKAREIIVKYKSILEDIAPVLLERETILRDDWIKLLEGTEFPSLPVVVDGGGQGASLAGIDLAPVKFGKPGWVDSNHPV